MVSEGYLKTHLLVRSMDPTYEYFPLTRKARTANVIWKTSERKWNLESPQPKQNKETSKAQETYKQTGCHVDHETGQGHEVQENCGSHESGKTDETHVTHAAQPRL